jgi:hypothetical protein
LVDPALPVCGVEVEGNDAHAAKSSDQCVPSLVRDKKSEQAQEAYESTDN